MDPIQIIQDNIAGQVTTVQGTIQPLDFPRELVQGIEEILAELMATHQESEDCLPAAQRKDEASEASELEDAQKEAEARLDTQTTEEQATTKQDSKQALYRKADGQLVVYVCDWKQGEPTRCTLHEITEADLQGTGRFAALGRETRPRCESCGRELPKSTGPAYKYDDEAWQAVYLCKNCAG